MQAYIRGRKVSKGCNVCGYNACHAALCFHHRSSNSKSFELNRVRCSWGDLVREIRKCDVLCLNCHAELHESGGHSSGGEDADVLNQLMLFELSLELT